MEHNSEKENVIPVSSVELNVADPVLATNVENSCGSSLSLKQSECLKVASVEANFEPSLFNESNSLSFCDFSGQTDFTNFSETSQPSDIFLPPLNKESDVNLVGYPFDYDSYLARVEGFTASTKLVQ